MKITNKAGIPEALYKFLKLDTYDYEAKGDTLSVTEILNPVQIVVLKRRYWDKIEVEAADRLWSVLGSGVHCLLEKEKGMVPIERLSIKVAGRVLSGKWDRIINQEVTDYKVTSAWAVAYERSKTEWRKQLSMYRWLYWKVKCVTLKDVGYIVALLRDWQIQNVGKMGYPAQSAIQIPFELIPLKETEEIIERRIKAITKAEKLKDKNLPECTEDERWYDERKKIYKRCLSYCEVSKFCKQFAKDR